MCFLAWKTRTAHASGNQRSAWQYRRQSATAGAANLGWCAIAGMRSLENRKSAIVGSASVHSCAIAGAKRGRRRYGAMERTAGFDGTAQGHPHYRGRTDGTWSCAGQSESAGALRFDRRTRCRNTGTGVSRRRATAWNRTRHGTTAIEEAAEYLDCDITAVIKPDAKLCSELLEGLGLRKPNRTNAKAIATLADLIQEALGEKSISHGTRAT